MKKRAVITGDIFRASHDLIFGQEYNVKWFSGLLMPILNYLGFEIEVVGYSHKEQFFADIYNVAYDANGQDIVSKWANIYDSNISDNLANIILSRFGEGIAFIFEGSRSLLKLFEARAVPFFNFRVHPLRFGTDLIFSIHTNDPNAMSRLATFSIDDNFIVSEVAQLRARMINKPVRVEEKSTVFLAQTANDSSLVVDGGIAQLANYEESVRSTVGDRKTYHKRHPHDLNEPTISTWCKMFPESEELTGSLYPLIASFSDISFISLSSGGAYEASLFGHKAKCLIHNHLGLDVRAQPASHVAYEFWYPSFWAHILLGDTGWKSERANYLPDRLRRTIGLEWSQR
jgi:hypothetical protein